MDNDRITQPARGATSGNASGARSVFHRTVVQLVDPVPAELEAGSTLAIQGTVVCSEGCDIRGGAIEILAPGGSVVIARLEDNTTGSVVLPVPKQIGEAMWLFALPELIDEEVVHEASSLMVRSCVKPHRTSMAVWGAPLPVVGAPFTIKVGLRCSALCSLEGQAVDVRDESGAVVGEGRVGGTPWPGTDGLYVADVEVIAPEREGLIRWCATAAASVELDLPHERASASFTFRVVPLPEHRVTVQILAKDADASGEGTEVRLGPYHAEADGEGVARLHVPPGRYALDGWKAGLEMASRTVDVGGDTTFRIEAVSKPDVDPDDDVLWM